MPVFGGFINDLYTVLGDPENIEMYMSFFLFAAMKRTGSLQNLSKLTSNEKGKLAAVMVTAGVRRCDIAVDDYVSAPSAGAAFSPLIDALKKRDWHFAYIIRTISICVSARGDILSFTRL